jgi:hypothetical protein
MLSAIDQPQAAVLAQAYAKYDTFEFRVFVVDLPCLPTTVGVVAVPEQRGDGAGYGVDKIIFRAAKKKLLTS